MSALANVKDIDIETKNCIFGYVRKIQEALPTDNIYYTIPSLVIHWILLYYHIQEKFDPNNCGKMCSLSESGSILTKTNDNYDIALLSKTVSTGTHRWKFKIDNINPANYTFVIGVWNIGYDADCNNSMFSKAAKNKLYGWNSAGGQITRGRSYFKSYGKPHKKGDIIEMILNLYKLELGYTLNGEDYGVCWSNIDEGKYKAMVHMYKSGDSIELVSYSLIGNSK